MIQSCNSFNQEERAYKKHITLLRTDIIINTTLGEPKGEHSKWHKLCIPCCFHVTSALKRLTNAVDMDVVEVIEIFEYFRKQKLNEPLNHTAALNHNCIPLSIYFDIHHHGACIINDTRPSTGGKTSIIFKLMTLYLLILWWWLSLWKRITFWRNKLASMRGESRL